MTTPTKTIAFPSVLQDLEYRQVVETVCYPSAGPVEPQKWREEPRSSRRLLRFFFLLAEHLESAFCGLYRGRSFNLTEPPASNGSAHWSEVCSGQFSGILVDAATNFAKSTPDGMNAIPPGSYIPFTIGVTNPVVRLVCEINDSVGFAAVGVAKILTAE